MSQQLSQPQITSCSTVVLHCFSLPKKHRLFAFISKEANKALDKETELRSLLEADLKLCQQFSAEKQQCLDDLRAHNADLTALNQDFSSRLSVGLARCLLELDNWSSVQIKY